MPIELRVLISCWCTSNMAAAMKNRFRLYWTNCLIYSLPQLKNITNQLNLTTHEVCISFTWFSWFPTQYKMILIWPNTDTHLYQVNDSLRHHSRFAQWCLKAPSVVKGLSAYEDHTYNNNNNNNWIYLYRVASLAIAILPEGFVRTIWNRRHFRSEKSLGENRGRT